MLDLAPIRERLDNIDRALEYDITDTALLRRVPDDVVALLDEVERLREEIGGWYDAHKSKANDLEYATEKLALREAEIKRLESIIQNARRQLGAA